MSVLLAPMRMEARAVRRGAGPGGAPVLAAGTGPDRAARCAARLAGRGVLVAGVGGGLTDRLRTGDVVVADRVRGPDAAAPAVRFGDAAALADALRAAGATVHIGTVACGRRIAAGTGRTRLAATGAILADTESYWLLSGPARPTACVRVVADCVPGPVFGPATLRHLVVALRRLRTIAAVLTDWAATRDPARSPRPLKEVR